jgi:aldose 1-epimerase
VLNETPTLAPDGLPYRLLTLRNRAGMVVTLMDWGATLLSARVPMPDGSVRETLLGCASPEQYVNQSAYLGASVGRYANRIAKSRFELDGVQYTLLPSQGENQLHGGRTGLINAAGRLFVKTTAKCCSRWIRRMAIRASRVTLSPPRALR